VEDYSHGVVAKALKLGTQDAEKYGLITEGAHDDTGKSSIRANNQNQAANICKTQHT